MRSRNIFTSLALIAFFSTAAFAQSGKAPSVQQVKDTEQPAKQSFYRYTSSDNAVLETVPEGKVLVIEHVTGRITTNAPGTGGVVVYASFNGSTEFYSFFGPTFYSATENLMFFGQAAKLYIPAGRTVRAGYNGNGQLASFDLSLSGHFVDVP